MLDERQRAACAATAAWLEAQHAPATWSLALTVVAVLLASQLTSVDGGVVRWALVASLAAGACAAYLALRCRLDAVLFRDLARGAIASLDDLDLALRALRLRPARAVARSLEARIDGARGFAMSLLAAVALQTLLVLPYAAAALVRP